MFRTFLVVSTLIVNLDCCAYWLVRCGIWPPPPPNLLLSRRLCRSRVEEWLHVSILRHLTPCSMVSHATGGRPADVSALSLS